MAVVQAVAVPMSPAGDGPAGPAVAEAAVAGPVAAADLAKLADEHSLGETERQILKQHVLQRGYTIRY